MSPLTCANPFFNQLANEHRKWLSGFDSQYLRNWDKLHHADEEAALAEARVRSILEDYRVRVEPNEDLTGHNQRPDFKCTSVSEAFYVEVTCISKEIATHKTGIPEEPHGWVAWSPLNDAVFRKCCQKASQCANLDGPALLAVGTFHRVASEWSFKKRVIDGLLTGEPEMAWDIDMGTGKKVGDDYQGTDFYSAAFLRRDDTEEVAFARSSLSALLLCGLGSDPPRMIGILHPNPARSFNPSVLPGVEFARVQIDRASRELRIRWP